VKIVTQLEHDQLTPSGLMVHDHHPAPPAPPTRLTSPPTRQLNSYRAWSHTRPVPTDHGFVFIRSASATAFVLRALNPHGRSNSSSLASTNVSLLTSPQPENRKVGCAKDYRTVCDNFPCRNIGASAIKRVEILRPTPPGPPPVLPTQHAIDNAAHWMAKWMWLSNLLQSGILTTNKIRDLDRRLSGHHQNC
jgi:hypothetical protein